MKKHLNLFFPQWQGGGQDTSTYFGAFELRDNYLAEQHFFEVPVTTNSISGIKNNILGYDEIFVQLNAAKNILIKEQPDTIFTLGGSCDADIAAISYLNHKTKGDLSILWFDAHGDLNTPASSASKYFYGMPLRTLLGEGDSKLTEIIETKLNPSQIIMLGNRDLDKAEAEYIAVNNITSYSVQDIELYMQKVLSQIKAKGHKKIHIHIDLDVLDPNLFSSTPVPEPNGLDPLVLQKFLQTLNKEFEIIGLGLFEYKPSGETKINLLEEIVQLGINL